MPGKTPPHNFFDTNLPIALAHRGGDEKFVENTSAAFDDAYKLGYRYFETDVHYTVDNELVAFHDNDLTRVMDVDMPIAALTQKQRLALHKVQKQHVPLLDELLKKFPDVYFHIDAKALPAVQPLSEIIKKNHAEKRVCVASFSAKSLLQLRKLLPDVYTTVTQREVAHIRFKAPIARIPDVHNRVFSIPTHVFYNHNRLPLLTPKSIQKLHDKGCKILVWTINEPDEMHRLLDWGVDGLFTDKLRALKKVLIERGQWPEA
jgi:glycerophosphoryl diester phosphodiesterase